MTFSSFFLKVITSSFQLAKEVFASHQFFGTSLTGNNRLSMTLSLSFGLGRFKVWQQKIFYPLPSNVSH